MEIKIGNWKISKDDDRNYVIEQKRVIKKTAISKNHGEEKYTHYGYFGSLQHALVKVVDRSLADSEVKNIKQLLSELKRVEEILLLEIEKNKGAL